MSIEASSYRAVSHATMLVHFHSKSERLTGSLQNQGTQHKSRMQKRYHGSDSIYQGHLSTYRDNTQRLEPWQNMPRYDLAMRSRKF